MIHEECAVDFVRSKAFMCIFVRLWCSHCGACILLSQALGMFGGKVAEYDFDWRATAAREFREEVGGLAEVLANEIRLRVRAP